jgi:hypothetical protein
LTAARPPNLNAVENQQGQARYPDDVPPVVAVDDGQALCADRLVTRDPEQTKQQSAGS